MDILNKLLAAAAINAIDENIEDGTCSKCKYFSDKQLNTLLTFGGGFHKCECDNCVGYSNFEKS